MSLGVTYNNPGDLTVSSSNPNLYSSEGQTGVYNSPNGLSYPTFGSVSSGYSALGDWLTSNVGTNDATSLTTPSELASYYLNGSYGGLSNTANNPAANNWLTAFDNFLGASPNSQLSGYSTNQLEGAIATAEGTVGGLGLPGLNGITAAPAGMTVAPTGNNTIVNGAESWLGNEWSALTGGTGNLLNFNPIAAGEVAGGSTVAAATAGGPSSATGILAPLVAAFNTFVSGFESGIQNAFARGGFAIVGILLLAAGIFILASNSKTVQSGVRAAASVA